MSRSREIQAGRAYVSAYLKDKISAGLQRVKLKLSSFAAAASKIGGGLLAGAFASGSLFYKPIEAASNLEETMNKFNVVFGDQAKVTKKWSDDFANDVGRSKQQIADFMASSQDLFVPMGIDPKSADAMSKTVTSLSIDLASFGNKNDGDVLNDIHAAITGSGEVMKKYGVILNQTAVNQELLNRGMDPKTASEATKAQARLAIIMRGTTAAQGDAVRSADSWANVQKRIAAVTNDTYAEIGKAILPTLSYAGKAVSGFIRRAGDFFKSNQGLIKNIAIGIGIVAGLGVALLSIGGIALAGSAAIGAMGTIATVTTTALSILGGAVAFLASPVGLIAALVIGGAGAWLYYTESGQASVSYISGILGELLNWGKSVFGGIYDAIAVGDWGTAGKIMWLALRVAFSNGIGWVMRLWTDFKTGMLTAWDIVAGTLKSVWLSVVNQIAKGLLYMVKLANMASESISGYKVIDIDVNESINTLTDQNNQQQAAIQDATAKNLMARLKERAEVAAKYNTNELQAELEGMIAAAGLKRKEFEAAQLENKQAKKAKLPELPDFKDLGKQAVAGGGSFGSFSARALELFGTGEGKDLEKRTAKATEQTAEETKRVREKLEKSGLKVT